jgi:hypothetical protein
VIYDKTTGNEIGPTDVTNVAVEKNYFTIELDGGPSDEGERLLAQIEAIQREGFESMRKGLPTSAESRDAVAWFIASQFARSPAFRRASLEGQASAFKQMGQMMYSMALRGEPSTRNWIRSQLPDLTDSEFDEHLRWVHNGDYTLTLNPQAHTTWLLDAITRDRLIGVVGELHWTMAYTRHPYEFIISDSPVSLWGSLDGSPYAGIATAKSVTVPVDRNRVLVLSHDPREKGIRVAEPKFVLAVNRATLRAADRFAYSNPLTDRRSLPWA